jgi:DtxR family Mn-dependent transcriptional regulator
MFAFPLDRLSAAQEGYVRAISKINKEIDPVSVTALATALGVTPPSVSGMIQRLVGDGLVEHRGRAGVVLTARGEAQALQIHRRHRLIETFLVQVLGLDWAEVHEEAEALEHHLSDRLVQALDRYLGHPQVDPHGHPIPTADGRVIERDLAPLAELVAGEAATVREVDSDDPERIRRWKEMGLVPGAVVRVTEREDRNGLWRLTVDGRELVTGRPGIHGLKVERTGPAPEGTDQ